MKKVRSDVETWPNDRVFCKEIFNGKSIQKIKSILKTSATTLFKFGEQDETTNA